MLSFNPSWKDPREHETVGQRRERKAHVGAESPRSFSSAEERDVLPGNLKNFRPFKPWRKKAPVTGIAHGAESTPPLQSPRTPSSNSPTPQVWQHRAESSSSYNSSRTLRATHQEKHGSPNVNYYACDVKTVGRRGAALLPISTVEEKLNHRLAELDMEPAMTRSEVYAERKRYPRIYQPEESPRLDSSNQSPEEKPLPATPFFDQIDIKGKPFWDDKLPTIASEDISPEPAPWSPSTMSPTSAHQEGTPSTRPKPLRPMSRIPSTKSSGLGITDGITLTRAAVSSTFSGLRISTFSAETGSEARTVSSSPRVEKRSSTFVRTLRKMENARVDVLCKRLNEDWDVSEPDMRDDVNFEKRLWALTALYQFRVSDPMDDEEGSPTAEALVGEHPFATPITDTEGKDILYLHGDIADSWHLAAKNPHDMIHHLTTSQDVQLDSPLGPIPPNLLQRSSSATVYPLPYQTSSLDLVLSRSLATLVRSTDWPPLLRECIRVTRPGGRLAISILEPIPTHVGPLLREWTATHLISGLERKFRVTQPGALLPFWLTVFPELTAPTLVTFTYPAVTADDVSSSAAVGSDEQQQQQHQYDLQTPTLERNSFGAPLSAPRRSISLAELRAAVGRHFYASLYEDFIHGLVPPGEVGLLSPTSGDADAVNGYGSPPSPGGAPRTSTSWWWHDAAIVAECMEYGTEYEVCTYWCRKK
ncbi:MAG: hypothetical protein M1833_000917 [Piccolia ochrophora]|nr:MAG: hypothetical protein M1833_000917 [Piccolia ochrophora]